MTKYFFLLGLLCSLVVTAQTVKKDSIQVNKEPIIYADGTFGYIGSNLSGAFYFGGTLNYQQNKNLYSVFVRHNSGAKADYALIAPFIAFPVFYRKFYSDEFGGLYGRRWNTKLGTSYSVSVGASITNLTVRKLINNTVYKERSQYLGVPFQLSVKWFKRKKKRFKVYGIIPVGKPTSFGSSFGFKIVGNISRNSYIGVGLSFGLGIHQKYN